MTGFDHAKASIMTNSGRLDVFHRPGEVLPDAAKADLLDACVLVARSGFGSEEIPISDILIHALDVEYGMYLYDHDEHLQGFSSAQFLNLRGDDLQQVRVLYLEGTAIHKSFQGTGAYYPFVVARCVLGLASGASILATRTANPVVCRALQRFSCYPFDPAAELGDIAEATAAYAYDHLSDYQAAGGIDFERTSGVVHRAYPGAMSQSIAWSDIAMIDDHFREGVDVEAGDAVLVAARIDRSTVAALTDRYLGGPLDQRLAELRPLATQREDSE